MTRSRLIAVFVSAFALAGFLAVSTPTTASGPPPNCASAGPGANVWTGGDKGYWSDSESWSLKAPPGAGSDQSACIRGNVELTFDVERVDLQRFELGRGSSLTMNANTALYVWGGADNESIARENSLIVVDGATLGGGGQFRVLGSIQVISSKTTTGQLDGDGADTGLMIVGEGGTLDFQGKADVRLIGGYAVEVLGRARLLGTAALVADDGTTFTVDDVGRFLINNDRGYLAPFGEEPSSEFVNNGLIVKQGKDGNSTIAANYSGDGKVEVHDGYLVLPDEANIEVMVEAGASVGSGTCAEQRLCGTDTTPDDQQFAALTLPETSKEAYQVTVTVLEGDKEPGAVGFTVEAHADELVATHADPAVIELRYDETLWPVGERPEPAELRVKRAPGAGGVYKALKPCTGGTVPDGLVACVDRREEQWGSRVDDGGDIIMVVRTTRTSRWIAD